MSAVKYNLIVKSIEPAGENAAKISFGKPENFTYLPGQYLTFSLPEIDENFMRSYSLSSSPYAAEDLSVGVKLVANGKVSTYLTRHLKVGDVIETFGPAGIFTTTVNLSQKRQIVLLAAGSGITPIWSMAKSILLMEPQTKVALIYGNRHEDSIMFENEIAQWTAQYADRFQVIHVLSKPSNAWHGLTGRVDKENVLRLIEQIPVMNPKTAEYYLCGPDGFMTEAREALKLLQVPTFQVKYESFSIAPTHELHIAEGNQAVDAEVKITYKKKEHTFNVSKDQTILSAAKELGIKLPHSCENGICTACIGKCTSGKVLLDDQQSALTDSEIEDGFVLTCVGFAASPNVAINLD